MKVTIRPADLSQDRSNLISLFRRYLTRESTERRFDWLYLLGPHGKASAWVAELEEGNEIVGAAAAFPRRMYAGGAEFRGYVFGDFCIHPSLRTLGPALQLQRGCLQAVAAARAAVYYDFPSDAMTAVYRRLGIEPHGQLVRLAKPLRVDRALSRKLKSSPGTRLLGAAGNWALKARDSLLRRGGRTRIDRHQGPCGEEFSRFSEQARKAVEFCVAESSEYLNWRFLSHPFREFEFLAARSGDTLLGYLVLSREGDDARIMSLRTLDEAHIANDLLLVAVDQMRKSGVMTLSASLLASDRRASLFESLGFRPRESRPVVFHPSVVAEESNTTSRAQWHLMDGDRDS
jgi:hypothetical protein